MILHCNTTVRVPSSAHPTLRLARDEILSFLKKTLGIRHAADGALEINFSVESGHGYQVSLAGGRLTFQGSTEVEVLYSVYTFAEHHLGFLFFIPGQDEYTPLKEINLSDGLLVPPTLPKLKIRGLVQEFAFSEQSFVLADWMVRNRLNYLQTWTRHHDAMSADLKTYFSIRGITIEAGHHNFNFWIPPEDYYEKHPEYFAIIGDQRIKPTQKEGGLLQGGQLCATNPAVRREISNKMLAYANKHPELTCIGINPNDGFGWCECAECMSFYDKSRRGDLYSVSEHVYRTEKLMRDFHADIARQVRAKRPDLIVCNCAYINYVEPGEEFRLTEGMLIPVALYWRCANHDLQDPQCPINSRYVETLRKWSRSKSGGLLGVYEYYMGINFYLSLPLVHHERMFREIAFLSSIGVDAIMTQFQMDHWVAYGLNYYAMARAAYGESISCIDIWFRRRFGALETSARAFYASLSDLQHSTGTCLIPYPSFLLKRTRLEDYTRLVALARTLSVQTPQDSFRNSLLVWAEYMENFKRLYDAYQTGEDVGVRIEIFLDWAETHGDHSVFLLSKVRRLMAAWKERAGARKPWRHFNIDWEDAYIEKHDVLFPVNSPTSAPAPFPL
jgi:hypothetical protein